MTTMAMPRSSGRPLPQPPGMTNSYAEREAAWYEHEERMRPSYIMRPSYGNPNGGGGGGIQAPPLSPSSRWQASTSVQQGVPTAQFPFPGSGIDYSASPQKQFAQAPQQQQQRRFAHSVGQSGMRPSNDSSSTTRPISPTTMHSMAETGRTSPMSSTGEGGLNYPAVRARPFHLNSSPSRLHSPAGNGYQPFALDDEEARRTGAIGKGSAFMHKGFFDILSLVNNPAGRPVAQNGFKATFSKATGRFRKDSNANGGARIGLNGGGKEDPFFSSPAPPLQNVTSRNSMQNAALLPTTRTNRMSVPINSSYNPMPSPMLNSGAALGPKAAKKRISIDMVGAPRIDSFVHAAHASDAEQAEEILRRWGRDNVGKIADPAWIERCKEAMRVQAARNQAEAIAQIQAALHQESAFRDNPKQLHIVNGTPSNLTYATATTATIGHSTLSGNSTQTQRPSPGVGGGGKAFEQIEEEVQQNGQTVSPMTPPHKSTSPTSMAQSPLAARPGMMPRTNTQGTMLVSSPGPLAKTQDVPDYLHFQPQPVAVNSITENPHSIQPIDERRASKAIDGLPGGGGAIDALFDRPVSMVVRDSLATTTTNNNNAVITRNIAGEAMADILVNHAGAAMRPSLTTVEKSVAAKIYFENLYYGILKKPQARETRKAGLEAELALLRIPDSSKEAIRNAWVANETEYLRDIRARVNVNSFSRLKTIGHGAFGVVALVQERQTGGLYAMKQLRKADMLRKGQEGHVRAERDLMTSASASQNAKWIVKLVYSFQDVDHLYLIMEFMGGGDLLNLLIEKDIFAEDFAKFYVAEMILAVHEAHRLGYIHRDIKPDNFLFTSQGHVKLADFGLCQSFHWAHDGAYYDQQRKNMLKKHGIDLEDSGSARAAGINSIQARGTRTGGKDGGALTEKELKDVMSDRNQDGTPLTHVLTWREKNRKKIAYSVVGTNNYMAPEVLRGLGYDQSCDWWSLGVIVFEMLYGYPPFVSKSRHLTRQKILNWRQTLRFPPKPKISREAQDFISKLICEREDRLGSQATASVSRPNSLLQGSRQQRSGFAAGGGGGGNGEKGGLVDGVEELMAHPWFRGIEWSNLHQSKAPFVPALSHPADTKHFEDDIDDEPLPAPGAAEAAKNGQPAPVEQARDPMLRDKAQGQHLLEMRKQLAFVGYTFKSPKSFDPKAQLTESKIVAAERNQKQQSRTPSELLTGSRLRSMSM